MTLKNVFYTFENMLIVDCIMFTIMIYARKICAVINLLRLNLKCARRQITRCSKAEKCIQAN